MKCPYCAASTTRKRSKKTELGYTTFFAQRAGVPFLLPCLRINYGQNGVAKRENRGTSMKPTSKCMGNSAIFIEPLILMAIERDSRLSEKRDMDAAQQFFKQAIAVVGHTPEYVTTDEHRSYPRAVHETMGNEVIHRTNVYLNNCIEQSHRGIKQRYYPMYGFGNFASASRFCRAFDELRQYFRPRHTEREAMSLAQQRRSFRERLAALQELIGAIS